MSAHRCSLVNQLCNRFHNSIVEATGRTVGDYFIGIDSTRNIMHLGMELFGIFLSFFVLVAAQEEVLIGKRLQGDSGPSLIFVLKSF